MSFADSYLGQLRALIGDRLVLMPGARIVIERADGSILLQKRTDFGLWGLPGGNAEEGEGLEAVVVREVLEETGLVVRDIEPFGFGCNPRYETVQFPNGDRAQFFALIFYTRAFEGEAAVADDESSAVEWFALDSLPEMLPNMARSVEAYLRFKTTGEFQMI
ncbi:NUDIX domain-containing protein [Mesorhizobium sp. B2-5-13]|uniref:NUDIX domain-containing protein n=1 Tax=unclassified Mesorhizobium TaxID=325217 RepID=UPI0011273690|nr:MULTISPECIES: NUDIX domain-containing protein [unclassified Mesorhizobium]TPJ38655.1 NUDIX domain-containing protein [Mesorhizobium sp. B2-6-5]TPJ79681.1 NUDIX domain-containing protein [Mesorhizobium sp. B2-5-13]TPK44071.1 NUDIX domain-containing protein [Mesorhizobium sp. B2-5-5]